MTDNDYLRAAVELSDGFSNTTEGFTRDFDDSGHDFIHFYLDEPSMAAELQFGLDALAAQLVRQLDMVEDWTITVFNSSAVIVQLYGGDEFDAHGNDRTMNTIKAIVDSEVLK